MNFDDYYMHLGVTPPSSDEPEEPEEDEKPSYFSSYVSVYVKPDPPPPEPTTPHVGSGVYLPDGTPIHPVSPPDTSTYDSRPDSQRPGGKPADSSQSASDISQTKRPDDDRDSYPVHPGTIVDDLQDLRPEYNDDLGQSIEDAYKDENGIYFQLYINQSTVRRNDFAESGLDDDSDWHATQRAYKSIDRYMNRLLQHGQEKSVADGDSDVGEYTVDTSRFNRPTTEYLEENRPDVETPDDFTEYVKTTLPKLIPEFANIEIDWESLPYEVQAIMYYAALEAGKNLHTPLIPPEDEERKKQLADGLRAIGDEQSFIYELLMKMAPTPLQNIDLLMAADGWDPERYPREEIISDMAWYYRNRVTAIYDHLNMELPSNWEEIREDPLTLANMVADAYPELEERGTPEFLDKYYMTGYDTFAEEYAKLTSNEKPFDPLPLIAIGLGVAFPKLGVAMALAGAGHSLVVEKDATAAIVQVLTLGLSNAPKLAGWAAKTTSTLPRFARLASTFDTIHDLEPVFETVGMATTTLDVAGAIPTDSLVDTVEDKNEVLEMIQTQATAINELSKAMYPDERDIFLSYLERGEEMTQDEMLVVLDLVFRALIRANG